MVNLRNKLRNMQLPVKYKRCTYKINLNDAFSIYQQQSWLFLRRILRLFKRIFLRSYNVLVVLLCAIIFSAIIVPFGLIIEEYNNWYDVLWDMRTFLLTSVLIVFVNSNVIEEKRRRESLQNQYYIYSSFMFDTEKYIEELLNIIGITAPSKIFLTSQHLDYFNNQLEGAKSGEVFKNELYRYKEPYIYLISIHNKQLHELRNILHFINSKEKLEMHRDSALKWTRDAIRSLEEEIMIIENNRENYDPSQVKLNVKENITKFEYIIAELRRPWRWDHVKNMDIKERIFYKGKVIGYSDIVEYWFN